MEPPINLDGAWSQRLREMFGVPLSQLSYADVVAVIGSDSPATEGSDLDYKSQHYKDESKKGGLKELASDVAAFLNDRGGMIIIGVEESDGRPVKETAVDLGESVELAMRSSLRSLVVPYATVGIRPLPSGDSDAGAGFWAITVPPSPNRPHAVVDGSRLVYPRRDGASTRHLGESEIADLYRGRFQQIEDQRERLERILREAPQEMDGGKWLTLALVPNLPGHMPITAARLDRLNVWVRERHVLPPVRTAGQMQLFDQDPFLTTGLRRVVLRPSYQDDELCCCYAEFHSDGSGVAALQLGHRQKTTASHLRDIAKLVRVLADHAVTNAGAYGDAAVRLRVSAEAAQLSARTTLAGELVDIPSSTPETIVLTNTLELGAYVADPQALLRVARVIGTDLVNALGESEIHGVTEGGEIRRGVLGESHWLVRWGEAEGVPVID